MALQQQQLIETLQTTLQVEREAAEKARKEK